jgi:hypothetical protein
MAGTTRGKVTVAMNDLPVIVLASLDMGDPHGPRLLLAIVEDPR